MRLVLVRPLPLLRQFPCVIIHQKYLFDLCMHHSLVLLIDTVIIESNNEKGALLQILQGINEVETAVSNII